MNETVDAAADTPSPLTLVVMAAGVGSRFDRSGSGKLKQLAAVGPNDETLLDYTIYDALRAGFGRVVFVVRTAIHADFDLAVGERIAAEVPVDYALQELDSGLPDGFVLPAGLERQKPWGTAHAALVARPFVGGPFAIVNADDFYGREAVARLAEALAAPASDGERPLHHLVAYPLRSTLSPHGPVSRGVCEVDAEGWLADLRSLREVEPTNGDARHRVDDGRETIAGDTPASMNLFGFEPAIFDRLSADFRAFLSGLEGPQEWSTAELGLPNVLIDSVHDGESRVKVHLADSPWFGITHPDDLSRVREAVARLIDSGEYPRRLWP